MDSEGKGWKEIIKNQKSKSKSKIKHADEIGKVIK